MAVPAASKYYSLGSQRGAVDDQDWETSHGSTVVQCSMHICRLSRSAEKQKREMSSSCPNPDAWPGRPWLLSKRGSESRFLSSLNLSTPRSVITLNEPLTSSFSFRLQCGFCGFLDSAPFFVFFPIRELFAFQWQRGNKIGLIFRWLDGCFQLLSFHTPPNILSSLAVSFFWPMSFSKAFEEYCGAVPSEKE